MGLKTPQQKSQLDRSVQFFSTLDSIINNYYLYKNKLEALASDINNTIINSFEYI